MNIRKKITTKEMTSKTLIFGGAGSGKTTLMLLALKDKIKLGEGITFIDGRADKVVVSDIKKLAIEADRLEDFVYYDYSNKDNKIDFKNIIIDNKILVISIPLTKLSISSAITKSTNVLNDILKYAMNNKNINKHTFLFDTFGYSITNKIENLLTILSQNNSLIMSIDILDKLEETPNQLNSKLINYFDTIIFLKLTDAKTAQLAMNLSTYDNDIKNIPSFNNLASFKLGEGIALSNLIQD